MKEIEVTNTDIYSFRMEQNCERKKYKSEIF